MPCMHSLDLYDCAPCLTATDPLPLTGDSVLSYWPGLSLCSRLKSLRCWADRSKTSSASFLRCLAPSDSSLNDFKSVLLLFTAFTLTFNLAYRAGNVKIYQTTPPDFLLIWQKNIRKTKQNLMPSRCYRCESHSLCNHNWPDFVCSPCSSTRTFWSRITYWRFNHFLVNYFCRIFTKLYLLFSLFRSRKNMRP